jgi:hypothetical protein
MGAQTPENIFEAIGPGYASLRAVHEALYEDHRFIRASRHTLDLRVWDIVTATRWAGYAKRDWNDFLAIRHAEAQQPAPERW